MPPKKELFIRRQRTNRGEPSKPATEKPSLQLVVSAATKELPLTGAVTHQVEELLFLTARPAAPTSKRDMGVTGSAVRFRRAVALPAGGVAFWGEKQKPGLESAAWHVNTCM